MNSTHVDAAHRIHSEFYGVMHIMNKVKHPKLYEPNSMTEVEKNHAILYLYGALINYIHSAS